MTENRSFGISKKVIEKKPLRTVIPRAFYNLLFDCVILGRGHGKNAFVFA